MSEGQFVIPPELEAGVYADVIAVWHTPHAFVLDFAAVGSPRYAHDGEPDEGVEDSPLMVARVRLPIGLVFALLQAISARMERYEYEWGEMQVPRRRGEDGEQGDP